MVEQTLPSSRFKIMVNNANTNNLKIVLVTVSPLSSTVFVCLCWGLGLVLERERKAFRVATVEPVHQLKDDLSFRVGEVQHQQLTAHRLNWEQVIEQVSV